MLPCQKCNYDNELGRIFCHQCGTKLDLEAIKPVAFGGKSLKRKKGVTKAALIRRGIELVLFLAMLLMVVLMLESPVAPPVPGRDDLDAAEKKWQAITRLVDGKKPAAVEISPSEANGFFASLKFEKADIKWGFVPERIWIKFLPGSVDVCVLTQLHLGGSLQKRIYFGYTGIPKIENGEFKFQPTGAAVGKLAWPSAVAEMFGFHDRVYSELFRRLAEEKMVLSQLQQFEVKPDRATVWYQPR